MKVEHPHGDVRRYRYGRCRCAPCTAANAAAMNRYRMGLASGRHQPDVDAEPVRQHVQRLQRARLSLLSIARLSGVAPKQLSALMYGSPSRGLPPSRRVRPATAEKVMAVHASLIPDRGWISSIGTRRRLQALAAIGWPIKHLEQQTRLAKGHAHRIVAAPDTFRVSVHTARAVSAVYDRLWDVDPATAGFPPGLTDRLRRLAADKGWLPPAAWDDLIDLSGEDLEQELRRVAALMDEVELQRCNYARTRLGDRSPLVVAGSREYERRRKNGRAAA